MGEEGQRERVVAAVWMVSLAAGEYQEMPQRDSKDQRAIPVTPVVTDSQVLMVVLDHRVPLVGMGCPD